MYNISTSLINQVNNQRHLYHPLTFPNLLDSGDDFRSGCRNVKVNATSSNLSQDYTHPDDHNLRTYDMTPGFKPFTDFLYWSASSDDSFKYCKCRFFFTVQVASLLMTLLCLSKKVHRPVSKPWDLKISLQKYLNQMCHSLWISLHQ